MLQLSQFKHVALATVLGTTALIGSAGHVFAQEPVGSVVMPPTAVVRPNAVVMPPPAGGMQSIVVQNGGLTSVIVLPAADASLVAPPATNATVPSNGAPLDNPISGHSPMSTILPWEMSLPSTSNVLTSNDPPMDTAYGTGAAFSNNPWKS